MMAEVKGAGAGPNVQQRFVAETLDNLKESPHPSLDKPEETLNY
jgi:hypothetical protein